jgi:hypothetical protein
MSSVPLIAGTPNKAEMALVERFFRAYGYRTYQQGRWDADWRQTMATFQSRVLGLPGSGLMTTETKSRLTAFYAYIGNVSAHSTPTPAELGWTNKTQMKAEQAAAAGFGGGGFGGGGFGGGGVGYNSGGDRSPGGVRDFILSNYPNWAPFLNHPELGPLIMQAGAEERDPAWLEAQIMATSWYRSTSDAQRQWELLGLSNPGERKRLVDGRLQSLIAEDAKYGLGMTAAEIEKMANDSLSLGWGEDQMRNYLSQFVDAADAEREGLVSDVYDQAGAMSGDWFVKSSDAQTLDFARKLVAGQMDPESMEGWYRDRAKEQYAHLGDVIDKGITLRQHFDPHIQTMASLLEVSPETIDMLNDAQYRDVLSYADPENQGQVRSMTLNEVADKVRKDKRWVETDNAKATATSYIGDLGEMFGMVKR